MYAFPAAFPFSTVYDPAYPQQQPLFFFPASITRVLKGRRMAVSSKGLLLYTHLLQCKRLGLRFEEIAYNQSPQAKAIRLPVSEAEERLAS